MGNQEFLGKRFFPSFHNIIFSGSDSSEYGLESWKSVGGIVFLNMDNALRHDEVIVGRCFFYFPSLPDITRIDHESSIREPIRRLY